MMNVHKTELDVGIDWPLDSPIVSEKDAGFSCLKDIAEDKLPSYFIGVANIT